jgi:hypothetical protein
MFFLTLQGSLHLADPVSTQTVHACTEPEPSKRLTADAIVKKLSELLQAAPGALACVYACVLISSLFRLSVLSALFHPFVTAPTVDVDVSVYTSRLPSAAPSIANSRSASSSALPVMLTSAFTAAVAAAAAVPGLAISELPAGAQSNEDSGNGSLAPPRSKAFDRMSTLSGVEFYSENDQSAGLKPCVRVCVCVCVCVCS